MRPVKVTTTTGDRDGGWPAASPVVKLTFVLIVLLATWGTVGYSQEDRGIPIDD